MANEELKLKFKTQLIQYLNLMDIKPEDIADDEPFFGTESSIGLDSIDSIEITVLLEREYKIKITDPKEARKILVNVNTVVDYILSQNNA